MTEDFLQELDNKKRHVYKRQPITKGTKIGCVVFSILGIWLLKQTFLALLLWLLPSIVAYITDRKAGRPLFQTVATLNFSGCFFFLCDQLFKYQNQVNHLNEMMQDNLVWLTVYMSAAAGYGIYYISPYIAMVAIRGVNKGRIMHLKNVQARLVRDWGPIVTEYPKQ